MNRFERVFAEGLNDLYIFRRQLDLGDNPLTFSLRYRVTLLIILDEGFGEQISFLNLLLIDNLAFNYFYFHL